MKQSDFLVRRKPCLQIHNILDLSRPNTSNLNYCEEVCKKRSLLGGQHPKLAFYIVFKHIILIKILCVSLNFHWSNPYLLVSFYYLSIYSFVLFHISPHIFKLIASASPGDLLKMQIMGPIPNLLNRQLRRWAQQLVLESLWMLLMAC